MKILLTWFVLHLYEAKTFLDLINKIGNINLSQVRLQKVRIFKNFHIQVMSTKDFIFNIKIVDLVAHHSKLTIAQFANKMPAPKNLQLIHSVKMNKLLYRHNHFLIVDKNFKRGLEKLRVTIG